MENINSIITIKEYGKIDILLKDILDARGLSRNYLATAANTRFEVINKWYNNQVENWIWMFWQESAMCWTAPRRTSFVISVNPFFEKSSERDFFCPD